MATREYSTVPRHIRDMQASMLHRLSRSKIQCLPRKWFERIKGMVLEEQMLARNKVVSIQSREVNFAKSINNLRL